MSYIYVMKGLGNRYKIGFTNRNPLQRLYEFKTANPDIELLYYFKTDHGQKVERTLHMYFNLDRIDQDREWFMLDDKAVLKIPELFEKIESNFNILKNKSNFII